MLVSKKDELYTYDELDFIKDSILSDLKNICSDEKSENLREKLNEKDSLVSKIENLQKSVLHDKGKKAVFFMPESTFDIFSIFQGNQSLCDITSSDLKLLLEAVENSEESEIKKHVKNKLKVLGDFLSNGNCVKPVVTAADYLSEL